MKGRENQLKTLKSIKNDLKPKKSTSRVSEKPSTPLQKSSTKKMAPKSKTKV